MVELSGHKRVSIYPRWSVKEDTDYTGNTVVEGNFRVPQLHKCYLSCSEDVSHK